MSSADFSSVLDDSSKPSTHPQKNANALESKHRKHSSKEKATVRSFDDNHDETDSSNDGEREDRIQKKQSSTVSNQTFVGDRVISDPPQSTPRSSVSSRMQQLLAATSKLQSQYLHPFVVAQERTEAMTQCLFNNRKKIPYVGFEKAEGEFEFIQMSCVGSFLSFS